MSVKVKHCLLIIILISVVDQHCSEATDLFNITEDAIMIGREILREMEKADPQNINITAVGVEMFKKLETFYDRHTEPALLNKMNTMLIAELSTLTLQKQFLKCSGYDEDIRYFEFLMDSYKRGKIRNNELYFTSHTYLDENVFDLQKLETEQIKEYNLHHLWFESDPDTGDNIMNILTNQSSNWVCWSSSRQQILYSLLNFITVTDAVRYILTQHFYGAFKFNYYVINQLRSYYLRELKMINSTWAKKDVIKKMKNLENDFIERNTRTLTRFTLAMAGQSREAWSCGENKYEYRRNRDKEPFTKLENLYQMYIVNEVDLNEDGTCKKECGNYYQTKQYGCYDGGLCKHQRTCNGTLWDCGRQIDATMNICMQHENDNARYKFVNAEGNTYGDESYCDKYVLAKSWPRGFYKCSYCTCTCDELNNNGDRYFNLRPIKSDIDSNYVITNARFRKINNIVHIQIEEGQLLNNGFINGSSIRWKEVENFTVYDENVKVYDFHTITWNKRKVYLGDTDSPQNYVLTGLRISSVSDGIKLEIGSTSFDFNNGKLSNTIEWTNQAGFVSEWSELKFEDKDEIRTNSNAKYIKFTTNDVKIDAGQSTIPYLDTEEVIYAFRVPFSGVGLFTKNKKGVGSFLALKFLTYNFANNM